MNINTPTMQLLERKIESLVREVLREKEESKRDEESTEKSGYGDVSSDDAYKRQYKAVEDYLNRPEIDATQVMAKALGFDPKDDSARSYAFKKLHKEKTPDGTGNYEFSPEDISKIFALMG